MKPTFIEFNSLNMRKLFGLGAMTLALAILPACSDDDLGNKNEQPTPDNGVIAEGVDLIVKNDPSLATTYRSTLPLSANDFTSKMAAAPSSTELDAMIVPDEGFMTNPNAITVTVTSNDQIPTTPSNKIKVPSGTYNSLPPALYINYSGKDEAGNGIWAQKQIQNAQYYIVGDVTIGGTSQDDEMEIYILNGGKLTDKSSLQPKTTIFLYNGGDILRADQQNEKSIHIRGDFYAEGDLVHDDTDIVIGGNAYTTGKLHGKNVTLNGGKVYAGCAVTAKEEVYLTGNNSELSTGYVSAPTIQLSGNLPLTITLRDGGYLHATSTLSLTNVGNVYVVAEKGGKAMVETNTLNCNNIDLIGTFQNLAIKYETAAGSQEGDFKFNENCTVKDNVKYVVETTDSDCAPYLVVDPEEENPTPAPEDKPTIENVGSISAPEHEHPISATSIFVNNNNDAYISWHTQGDEFHGCIEHATVKDNIVNLQAYLETSSENSATGKIDFNHVIYDNGKIFVAGDHPKKGGILGWIDCNNGTFPSDNKANLNLLTLYRIKYTNSKGEAAIKSGGSGNCIIRNGNYYQVASVGGFETYNVSDFAPETEIKPVGQLASWNFKPGATAPTDPANLDGSNTGKHIATDGTNVAMLTLIDRDNKTNTATASIKVYSNTDVTYTNPIASYVVNDVVLTPVNGKNVIAIEGNAIWVCLGKGGVKHFSISGTTLTEISSLRLADMSKADLKAIGLTEKEAKAACANGLAVDGDYVYLAHGGAGLIIVDKDTLEIVANTRNHGEKNEDKKGSASANYIALANNYIYVAYGMDKVQVYSLKK